MKHNIIITAIGKDQPGIVAAVTKVLFEKGCNLEDSSMTILEGEFAMILIVSMPETLSFAVLDKHFDEVRHNLGLSVLLKSMNEEEMRRTPETQITYMISVYGADQPGIVYHVTKTLADLGINISDVNTQINNDVTPSVYMMMLEVNISEKEKVDRLQSALEALSKKMSIHVTIHDIDTLVL
ncbi:MAG: ACT domain-containing protein [Chlamydiota bacterium]|nr:ACT domain-containing protein [Chlamydiota bacterium]